MMPNIGPLELGVVILIALLVFGPKRLPELGRSTGQGIREFKQSISVRGSDTPELPEGGASERDGEGRAARTARES